MPDNLKLLARKISDDIRHLYYLLERTIIKRGNDNFELQEEIDKRLRQINENSELLSDIANDVDWDNKSNRRFQKLNAILLIFPTIIGMALLFWGIVKISATKEVASKLTQEINQKDSVIKELTKVVAVLPDSTKSKLQLADSIKKLNQTILDFKFSKPNLNTTYFRYEFSGKTDSINLSSLNVDLVILNNTTDKHLNLSVIKPINFPTKDILFTSADPSNSFGGPDGQMDTGQLVIISVAKLKQLNQDITLQFDTPSLKEQPPFQFLTLKIK